jgi:hypothetical protein
MTQQRSPEEIAADLAGLSARVPRHGKLSRSRIPLWIIPVAIIVVIAGGIGLFYLLNPWDAPIPEDAGAHYTDLAQGYTSEGYPMLGDPDAPIVIEDFSSYACPHCLDFHQDRFPSLIDGIAAGQIRFVFIPVSHIGPGAENAVRGALCSGQQGRFWEMHDVLFYWQSQFITSIFNSRRIRSGAENLGLDVAAFEACVDGDGVSQVIELARQEFDQRGLRGTPSFFINGKRVADYREFDLLDELAEEDS